MKYERSMVYTLYLYIECPQGLWGDECAHPCDCTGRGMCSPHDGSCDCDPGWMGQSCEKSKLLNIFTTPKRLCLLL